MVRNLRDFERLEALGLRGWRDLPGWLAELTDAEFERVWVAGLLDAALLDQPCLRELAAALSAVRERYRRLHLDPRRRGG